MLRDHIDQWFSKCCLRTPGDPFSWFRRTFHRTCKIKITLRWLPFLLVDICTIGAKATVVKTTSALAWIKQWHKTLLSHCILRHHTLAVEKSWCCKSNGEDFSKVIGYKSNIQTLVAFVYTRNEKYKNEIETIPFKIASKKE